MGLCARYTLFFFLMIRRPPRSTLDRSSAASDVYKRQRDECARGQPASESVQADAEAHEVIWQGWEAPTGIWEPELRTVGCLLYTSPSPRDRTRSRMPSSA